LDKLKAGRRLAAPLVIEVKEALTDEYEVAVADHRRRRVL